MRGPYIYIHGIDFSNDFDASFIGYHVHSQAMILTDVYTFVINKDYIRL